MSQVLQCTQLAKLTFSFIAPLVSFAISYTAAGRKILARIAVLFDALCNANIGVQDVQVARLIFIVARSGMVDVGQPVKRKFPVTFESLLGICRALRSIELFVVLISGIRAHWVYQPAPAGNLLKRCLHEAV